VLRVRRRAIGTMRGIIGRTLEEARRTLPLYEFQVIANKLADGTTNHYIVTADYVSTRVNVVLHHHNIITTAQVY
jgi:hypothetical protein